VPWLSISMLGVCPSNAILLRQTIRKHLRRSRFKTFLNVFQRIRPPDVSSLRPCICQQLLCLATKDYSDRLLAARDPKGELFGVPFLQNISPSA
jgi:hypothetical protein